MKRHPRHTMVETISVNARLSAITTLADDISSALNDEARNQTGTLSRSSGTLDRLERILPQVKELLEIFDGVAIGFRDQERCRTLKMKGNKEVGIIERRISFSRRSWAMRRFAGRSKRESTDEGSSSNEEASEANIAGIIKGIKDISNPLELVTRNDITTWIGRRDFTKQQDFHELLTKSVKRWRINNPEHMSLLAHPAFLSWASFSEPPSVDIINTPKNLDLKRIFWHQDSPTVSRLILVTTVIDSLMKDAISKNVGIAYCHFEIGWRNVDSNSHAIIRFLACQLCEQQQGDVPARVLELYHMSQASKSSEANSPPNLNDVGEVFLALCSQFTGTIVVLDGLDEDGFHEWEIPVADFRELAKWALATTSSKYFVTSRHPFDIHKIINRPTTISPDVEEPSLTSLDYQVTDINLHKYLDQQLSIHPSITALMDYQLLEEIVSTIKERAGGVFSLARLQFSIVLSKTCRRDTRTALETLPSQPDEIYKIILRKIRRQDEDHAGLAQKSLLWLATSLRPLKIGELRYALAIERGVDYVDRDSMPSFQSLEKFSMGLIYTDLERGTCDLAHQTLRTYLQAPERQDELVSGGEAWILSNCLTLLTYKSVCKPCVDAKELEKRISSDPFLTYAAAYWGLHAKSVCDAEERNWAESKATGSFESSVRSEILAFLQNEEALLSAMQIVGPRITFGGQEDRRQTSQILTSTSPLCAAADYGLLSIVERLLVPGTNANVQDSWGETPLHLASYSGHDQVVKMLLSNDADVTKQDLESRTPLDCANSGQQKEIQDILVEHIGETPKTGVSAPGMDRRALLFAAIYEGDFEQVSQLIEDGVELHGRDFNGQTVLQAAASRGDQHMFLCLMGIGADLSEEGKDVKSPFFIAVEKGHEGLVKLLLDLGTDISAKSGDGRQPLHCAAAQGFTHLIELLLENGADVNSVDNLGRSPLYDAVSNGHDGAAKLLLQHGASPVTSPHNTIPPPK